MHCISFLQMPPTRFLSFLFSLLIFCTIAESSPFAGNIKACFLDQPKPKAIPAQGSKPTQRTVPKIETLSIMVNPVISLQSATVRYKNAFDQ